MTTEEPVVRKGTSRAGMVMVVPQRATGREKANTVKAHLAEYGVVARVSSLKGKTYLTAEINGAKMKLVWDEDGRWDYPSTDWGGKKVRNAAAAVAASRG